MKRGLPSRAPGDIQSFFVVSVTAKLRKSGDFLRYSPTGRSQSNPGHASQGVRPVRLCPHVPSSPVATDIPLQRPFRRRRRPRRPAAFGCAGIAGCPDAQSGTALATYRSMTTPRTYSTRAALPPATRTAGHRASATRPSACLCRRSRWITLTPLHVEHTYSRGVL
jgi:hypothetical protein